MLTQLNKVATIYWATWPWGRILCVPQSITGYQPRDPQLWGGYLLCCYLVWLLLKEILENLGLNVRKWWLKDFWIFPPRRGPVLRHLSLFCWQQTCKIRLIYRKLPLTDESPKCLGWEGSRIWSYILMSTHILTSQQWVLGYKLVIPYLSESF